ncbi:hypothetical protein [Paenibacillus sp. NPDC101420]|uniref:hypothetical protein n=1 Tax=Paenibacillus sp. NPDC101420 TaxID=3390602 RepID=UPI003CFFE1D3
MESCKMPDCKEAGTLTWALVPICAAHSLEIRQETAKYYARRIGYQEREKYMGIIPLIPWSRRE